MVAEHDNTFAHLAANGLDALVYLLVGHNEVIFKGSHCFKNRRHVIYLRLDARRSGSV
jgi:hypothetical protein